MKKLLICLLLTPWLVEARVCESIQSGLSSASSSWNYTPQNNDTVIIRAQDTIFLDANLSVNKFIIQGVLQIGENRNLNCSQLELQNQIIGNSNASIQTDRLSVPFKSTLGRIHLTVRESSILSDTLLIDSKFGIKRFRNLILQYNGVLLDSLGSAMELEKVSGPTQYWPESKIINTDTALTGSFICKQLTVLGKTNIFGNVQILESINGDTLILPTNQTLVYHGTKSNCSIEHFNAFGFLKLTRTSLNGITTIHAGRLQKLTIGTAATYKNETPLTIDTLEILANGFLSIEIPIDFSFLRLGENALLNFKNQQGILEIENAQFGHISTIAIENPTDSLFLFGPVLPQITIGNSNQPITIYTSFIETIANSSNNLWLKGDSITLFKHLQGNIHWQNEILVLKGNQNQLLLTDSLPTTVNDKISGTTNIKSNFIQQLLNKKGKCFLEVGNMQKIINQDSIIFTGSISILDSLINIGSIACSGTNLAINTNNFLNLGRFVNSTTSDFSFNIINNIGQIDGGISTGSNWIIQDSIFGIGTAFLPNLFCFDTLFNKSHVEILHGIEGYGTIVNAGILGLQSDSNRILADLDCYSFANSIIYHSNSAIDLTPKATNYDTLIISGKAKFHLPNALPVNHINVFEQGTLDLDSNLTLPGTPIILHDSATIIIGDNQSFKYDTLLNSNIQFHDESTCYLAAKGDQICGLNNFQNLLIDDGAVDSSKKSFTSDSLLIKGFMNIHESSVHAYFNNKVFSLYGSWLGIGHCLFNNSKVSLFGTCTSNASIETTNSVFYYLGDQFQSMKVGPYNTVFINKEGTVETVGGEGHLTAQKIEVQSGTLALGSEKLEIDSLIIRDKLTISSHLQDKVIGHLIIKEFGEFISNYKETILVKKSISNSGNITFPRGTFLIQDTLNWTGLGNNLIGSVQLDSANLLSESLVVIKDSLVGFKSHLNLNGGTLEILPNGIVSDWDQMHGQSSQGGKIKIIKNIPQGVYHIDSLGLSFENVFPMGETNLELMFVEKTLIQSHSIPFIWYINAQTPVQNLMMTIQIPDDLWPSDNGRLWKSNDFVNWTPYPAIFDSTQKTVKVSDAPNANYWTIGTDNSQVLLAPITQLRAERKKSDVYITVETDNPELFTLEIWTSSGLVEAIDVPERKTVKNIAQSVLIVLKEKSTENIIKKALLPDFSTITGPNYDLLGRLIN